MTRPGFRTGFGPPAHGVSADLSRTLAYREEWGT